MHWLDSTILALLVMAAVLGAYSGLIMQLFRLIGFGLSLYAATYLNDWAAERLAKWFLQGADSRVSAAVAFAAVFAVVYAVAFLVTLLVERCVRAAQLQTLNRVLGAALATGKMALILAVVCFAMQRLPLDATRQAVDESVGAPLLARGVELALNSAPEEHRREWLSNWQQMQDALPTKVP